MVRFAMLVLASLFSVSAFAEDKCSPAVFGPEVTAQYPKAWMACRGLKSDNGSIYVHFIGKVDAVTEDTVAVIFEDQHDKPVSKVVFAPKMDTKIKVGGREVTFAKLKKGDVISVYIPSSKWGLYGDDPKGPNLPIVSREDLTQ